MKKLSLLLAAIIVFFAITYSCLVAINRYYDNKVKSLYSDDIGDAISVEKNEGLILQSISIEKKIMCKFMVLQN